MNIPKLRPRLGLRLLAFAALALHPPLARAADADTAARQALAAAVVAEESAQPDLVVKLAATPSPVLKDLLDAWQRGGIYIYSAPDGAKIPFTLDGGKPVRIDTATALLDATGAPVTLQIDTLEAVDTSSKLRRAIRSTVDLLDLAAADPDTRKSAILKLGMKQSPASLPILEARLAVETDAAVHASLLEAIAITNLASPDAGTRIAALAQLKKIVSVPSKSLVAAIAADANAPAAVRDAAASTLKAIDNHLFWVDFFGTIFRGISLGSVLLVVALGLAITFGLMGVINMAHGEIMVVGGYATYLTQCVFGSGVSLAPFGLAVRIPGFGFDPASGLYQSYFLFALPVAFFAAAAVGLLLERSVIQFLYRRPLESLLATWGVSLVLQQVFRLVFGPANAPVYSPAWLLGSFSVGGVMMNYNRVFVIGFAIVIVLGTALLLAKTPLGLLIRAVMQDRNMASCMGVSTEKVNMLTFAFGCGLAGLAGAFLSQIGNIGPGTGQTYIVDSFMVVVVGGVGNLIGTVISALGIGTTDQVLQTILRNPVIGKVLVLVAIILFLQWKPSGLFATKGRGLEN
jgi:urea transport system permease protein